MGKKEKKNWSLSVGFYPGILIGMRTYVEDKQDSYVLYLPFVDIALEVFK
jgi:hypothetical protein